VSSAITEYPMGIDRVAKWTIFLMISTFVII
jgi:hypothetical protein